MIRPERRLVLVSEPLPECSLCETPTRRDVHERLGGLCTACDSAFTRIAGGLPPGPDQLELGEDDHA